MIKIMTIAHNTILETLSKKHFYVLIIILFLIFFGFSQIKFFGFGPTTGFIRIIPLAGISLLGLLISTFSAARQLPQEIENRTLYPLLSKPLQRWQFLFGKYVGVEIIVNFSLVVIALLFYVLMRNRGVVINRTYWQAVVVSLLQLAIFTAVVFLFSMIMSYAACVAVSFLAYFLLCSAGPAMEQSLWEGSIQGLPALFYKVLIYITPRLDLFNFSVAVKHNLVPQSWSIILPFILYAIVYILVILGLTTLVFNRKEL